MNKMTGALLIGILLLVSCGPSAETMAKKSCDLHMEFIHAEAEKDSFNMFRLTAEIGNMENNLQKEYMYKNPEWLLKYVKLRDQCILEKTNQTPKADGTNQRGI
jgi:hypothetical protein